MSNEKPKYYFWEPGPFKKSPWDIINKLFQDPDYNLHNLVNTLQSLDGPISDHKIIELFFSDVIADSPDNLLFLATDPGPWKNFNDKIKPCWPNMDYDYEEQIMIVQHNYECSNPILELLELASKCSPMDSYLLGIFNRNNNWENFSDRLKYKTWYETKILGELECYYHILESGCTEVGRKKNKGPWSPEIEALIDRSPEEEEQSPSGCSPWGRKWW